MTISFGSEKNDQSDTSSDEIMPYGILNAVKVQRVVRNMRCMKKKYFKVSKKITCN
jgi:hypothetical protein